MNHFDHPGTRTRQEFNLSVSPEFDDESDGSEALTELLSKTWTIFGVSALFDFRSDEVYLKQCAKRLREAIANSLSQENATYSAKVFILDDVKPRPSPIDPPPIKVEVYAKTIDREKEKNVEKCIYNGILLSWRTTTNGINIDNTLRLPLLLCRGTRSAMTCVHATLNRMFDCMVIPLHTDEHDLTWLLLIVILMTSKGSKSKRDEVCLAYTIPRSPVTDAIKIKFQCLDLVKMLRTIIETHDKSLTDISLLTIKQVEQFWQVLHSHMLNTTKLQMGLCTLHRIDSPTFTIMGNRMKVMNEETMNRVLLYLNEKALDIFYRLQFNN